MLFKRAEIGSLCTNLGAQSINNAWVDGIDELSIESIAHNASHYIISSAYILYL